MESKTKDSQAKETYSAPQLSEHGAIEDITGNLPDNPAFSGIPHD
jgi:hypothetical protein